MKILHGNHFRFEFSNARRVARTRFFDPDAHYYIKIHRGSLETLINVFILHIPRRAIFMQRQMRHLSNGPPATVEQN